MRRLILLLGAVLLLGGRTVSHVDECKGLNLWYASYNELYFLGALPKDTVVDRADLGDDVLASTTRPNKFRITFNTRFQIGSRLEHLILLHESCHVRTWNEKEQHGKLWMDCMRRIRDEGAFEGLLIDGYAGAN